MFSNCFSENSFFYKIMWKKFVDPCRTQKTMAYILCLLDN